MKIHKLFLTLVVFVFVVILQAEPVVTASVDQSVITLRSRLVYTLELQDFDSFPGFSPDFGNDFTIINGPSRSSNFSMINGTTTSSKTLSYTLAPLGAGDLEIPSFNISYKLKNYTVNAIRITVLEANQPANKQIRKREHYFVNAIPGKNKIWLGETIPVLYKLYFQGKVSNYSFDPVGTVPGFLVENLKQDRNPTLNSELLEGVNYSTAVLRRILVTPTESGTLTIPLQSIRLEVQKQSRGSIFDDPFFGSGFTQPVDVIVPALNIEVMPLPQPKPDNFTGAVGEYRMSVNVDSSTVEANQAFTMAVTVTGDGNLKNFTFPKPEFPSAFQVFEPHMKEDVTVDGSGIKGSKTWEFVLIADSPGQYDLPAISFDYFSPRKNRYASLVSPGSVITVSANTRLVQEVTRGLSSRQVEILNQDIRFIRSSEGILYDLWYSPMQDLKNWLGYLLAVIMLLGTFLHNLFIQHRLNNPDFIRRLNAYKKAMQALDKHDQTFHEISRILSQYLADHFTLKEGEVHYSIVLKKLEKEKEGKELASVFTDLWNDLDRMKFAPAADSAAAGQLRERIVTFIKQAEKR